jgi:hypothetical protein
MKNVPEAILTQLVKTDPSILNKILDAALRVHTSDHVNAAVDFVEEIALTLPQTDDVAEVLQSISRHREMGTTFVLADLAHKFGR